MKKFITNNIRILLLIIIIFIFILLLYIVKPHKSNNKGIDYKFDMLKEGDIIPFNSTISGNFNLYVKFESLDKKTLHFITPKFIKANHTNIYYCKSKDCLKNNKYNLIQNLYKVGEDTSYKYNVPSYNEIFSRSNKEYTGWEVHFIPFEYYNENFHTMYIGTYYDIVLVPTTSKKNECLKDIDNWGISNEFKIKDISDTWKVSDNSYYLDNNKGYISIEFNAKKGDRIFFDLKNTSNSLKIFLNDEEYQITKMSYFRYETKVIYIEEDNKYILKFEDDEKNNIYYESYNKITSIKNIIIYNPSSKEKSNIFYTYCGKDILIGKSEDYE